MDRRGPVDAARAAGRPAGPLRGPGHHPLRRGGDRRRPGHDGGLRGDLGRRTGPARRRRSPTSCPGRTRAPRRRPGSTAPGRPARRRRTASRRCWRRSSTAASPVRSGRELLDRHLADGTSADALLAGAGPGPISDDEALLGHVDAVIAANPKAVDDYRAGKPVIGFFVGQVMKATAGRPTRRASPCSCASAWTRAPERMAVLAPGPDRRRRRPDRRRRAARVRAHTSGTRPSRSRTPTSPATRRGAAACDPTTPRPARRSRCRSSAARPRSGGAIVIAGVVAIVIGFILR